MSKDKIELKGNKVSFAVDSDGRINWLPFMGTCLFTDELSAVPCGSDKPVMFPHDEVVAAANTMVNMGVDCVYPDGLFDDAAEMFCGHNDRFKFGIVTSATVNGNEMMISGGLWDNDFYDVCWVYTNAKKSLGFSVEVFYDAEDAGDHYIAHNIEFTGVAILFADLAAFNKTYIAAKAKIAAAKGGNDNMTDEQMKSLIEALSKSNSQLVEGVKAEFSAQITALVDKISSDFAARDAKEKADKEAIALAAKEKEDAEAKAKAEAELAAQKAAEEAKKTEPQRKSAAFTHVVERWDKTLNEAQEKIKADKTLSPSQQFAALVAAREDMAQ